MIGLDGLSALHKHIWINVKTRSNGTWQQVVVVVTFCFTSNCAKCNHYDQGLYSMRNYAGYALTFFAAIMICASRPASAGQMVLEYQAVTVGSSIAGVSIDEGTPFSLKITSSNIPYFTGNVGQAIYAPLSIVAEVDGTEYSADVTGWDVGLTDLTSDGDNYRVLLIYGGSNAFLPFFSSTSAPGWNAQSPSSTEFTDYIGSNEFQVNLSTPSGELILGYDYELPDAVRATITILVPEPSTLALVGLGVIGFGLFACRNQSLHVLPRIC